MTSFRIPKINKIKEIINEILTQDEEIKLAATPFQKQIRKKRPLYLVL